MSQRHVLWVGDAVSPTGFAKATHNIIEGFLAADWKVSVLGLNYWGDPHPNQDRYDVYPANGGGDAFGMNRIGPLTKKLQPDIVFIQNDPWNFPGYMVNMPKGVPVIGVAAVDGELCLGELLNPTDHMIFWTEFGQHEARLGGYTGPSSVIPLGVDIEAYTPQDKIKCRKGWDLEKVFGRKNIPLDAFIIGVVGRNNIRKRFDLAILYVAEWIYTRQLTNVVLWIHAAPTGDDNYNLAELVKYADRKFPGTNFLDRVVTPGLPMLVGMAEDRMTDVYGIMDVYFNPAQGEGFGLPGFEAMACGVPVIATDWAGFAELARDAAGLIPCSTTSVTTFWSTATTIGGVPDKDETLRMLDDLYQHEETRTSMIQKGLTRVEEDRFRWQNISAQYVTLAEDVLTREPPCEHVWKNVTMQEDTMRVFRCVKCSLERREARQALQPKTHDPVGV